MRISILVSFIVLFFSCKKEKTWTYVKSVSLGSISPIGIEYVNNHLWISDGDNNQIIQLSVNGIPKRSFPNYKRPMHLSSDSVYLYIPEYSANRILKRENEEEEFILEILDSLDAPAGVDIYKTEIAITDFYNHRIVFYNGKRWINFGEEGNSDGEFYYPTDVQVTQNKIYVADTYNNRVQVFNKKGEHLLTIGEDDEMNATTGLFVSLEEVFITDFENDRILIYNLEGQLKQMLLDKELNKPADAFIHDSRLYITNYIGKSLSFYEKM